MAEFGDEESLLSIAVVDAPAPYEREVIFTITDIHGRSLQCIVSSEEALIFCDMLEEKLK